MARLGSSPRSGGYAPAVAGAAFEYQTRVSPAFEEYCEAIWELKEDDVDVIQARIAERLHVSRPAVSEMIKRMQAEGFVSLDGSTINLTADGRHLAEQVVRAIAWPSACSPTSSACRGPTPTSRPASGSTSSRSRWMRHQPAARQPNHLSPRQPDPGSEYAAPRRSGACDLPVGSAFTVTRIPEELEFTPGLLEFLEDAAVQPGHRVVTAVSPDQTTTVEIGGRHVGIGAFATARILVTADEAAPVSASA